MEGAMKKLLMTMLALALLAGCTSQKSTPAEKPQPKPAEFETGRVAFQKMYVAAHGWARDAQPFRMQSRITADCNGHDGKSAVWWLGLASPSQKGVKPYTWSGTDAADAPSRGVTPGSEDSYSPTNSSTAIFDIAYLKIDSDQAFQVAQKHGGDKLLEKAADTPVTYILDWSGATNTLVWHVIYGPSREDAKLVVDINASSGDFIRVEK
jgi:hypothetical protein